MANISPTLKYLKSQLADLERKVQRVQVEIGAVSDILMKEALENRLNILFEDMTQAEQKIQTEKKKLVREKFDRLVEIFQSDEDQKNKIQQAYKKTLSRWSAKVKQNVDDVQSMVDELVKIPQSSLPYSALDEFIANLFKAISDAVISNALTQWGQEYCQDGDWMSLYEQIQESQDKRLEKAQPAIVITITRSDEASTQSQDGETYYQLESWLIEDIDIYQTKKTGFHSLLVAGSPDNAPCLLEEMLQNITHLLDRLLSKQRDYFEGYEKYPEIHVFLPLELMHLGVDVWLINSGCTEYLGHDHLVFIRCANRYNRTYTKVASWKNLWNRRQSLLQEEALNVFVEGHDNNIDELKKILYNAVQQDCKAVGLQVTDAPVNTEYLVNQLLYFGLPIAIWSRSNLAESAHQTQVKELLTECYLETLPLRVKNKRSATCLSENTKENHIGHHLSLLWDNPHFYPPKSA
jgi:hypothetical protein